MSRTITKTEAETVPKLGSFTASEALTVLWDRAVLKPHEVEWFAKGAERIVSSETIALSEIMMNIGCLVLSDEAGTGSFTDSESASNLMFNLSSQLATLNGLAHIAIEANARVRMSLGGQP